jgi:carbamoyltransferase
MAYNILGINTGFHGSASLISDGKLVYYLEEERLSKIKKDSYPFKVVLNILSKFSVDEIVIAGTNYPIDTLSFTGEELFATFLNKFAPNIPYSYLYSYHHLCHASSAFYNSGFDKALSIVIDGQGSRKEIKINGQNLQGDEVESSFLCSYKEGIKKIHGVYLNSNYTYLESKNCIIKNSISIGKSYETITKYLGWHPNEGGKTMGLSSYGKRKINFKDFFNLFSLDTLFPNFQNYNFTLSSLKSSPEDIANSIQIHTELLVEQYISKMLKDSNLSKICCSGGYFLNCVNNYKLIKKFPNIDFYFEPRAHDGGLSVGAALYKWQQFSKSNIPLSTPSLYNGPQYSKEQLIEGIKKYVSN